MMGCRLPAVFGTVVRLLARSTFGLSAALFAAHASAQEDRKITSIAPEDCVYAFAYELGGSWACPGVGPYTLAVTEADLRMEFDVIHADWRAVSKIDLRRLSPAFSSFPDDQVEWLLIDQQPTALMITIDYSVGGGGGDPRSISLRLVVRLDAGDPARSCLVAALPMDARGDAKTEEKARAVARAAAGRPCLI